jgi:hypothetical protein
MFSPFQRNPELRRKLAVAMQAIYNSMSPDNETKRKVFFSKRNPKLKPISSVTTSDFNLA